MPQIQWRKNLEQQFKLGKRAQRYELRKRAHRAMEDLTFILQKIASVAPDPGREFSLIFKDEKRYFQMIHACRDAYDESFKSRTSLFRLEDLDLVQTACAFAGIKIHSKRQLSDRHFRQKVLDQLQKSPYHDEGTCYDWLFRKQQERHESP